MEIQVRPMQAEDLDAIMNIEESVFPAPWQRRGFESELTQNRFSQYYVAHADDKVLGYAGMWIILDESHLTTLAVDSAYQRKGVGAMLLQHLLVTAEKEGVTSMSLEVRPSNKAARSLYAGFGFQTQRIRKKYYPDEDAIIMVNDKIIGIKRRLQAKPHHSTVE